MWIQRASAFSNSVVVSDLAAFSEQVEAEWSCYREPQPLYRYTTHYRFVEDVSVSL